jgi:hypothetical protein
MMRSLIGCLATAWWLGATGCTLSYEPDVGLLHAIPPDGGVDVDAGTTSQVGSCGDSNPDVAVSFARDIRPLLARSSGGCGCHGTSATSGFSVGSYDTLRRGGATAGARVVIAGKPCESVLVQKLGVTPPFGSRMPFNGPPYFTTAEIALVRDWIAEGALNN